MSQRVCQAPVFARDVRELVSWSRESKLRLNRYRFRIGKCFEQAWACQIYKSVRGETKLDG